LVTDLFTAIDACDVDRFLGFIDPEAHFRFGSAPAVKGHDAIAQLVTGFFESISGLRHKVINTFSSGSMLVCEGDVTYTRLDAREVVLPFVNIFEFGNDLICDYRIYIDIAPLYSD
jgi:limonene-1,2-epoxide hydrolase